MIRTIIHWSAAAELGGCEILLDTFLQGEKNYKHIIYTGSEGPAISMWIQDGAEVHVVKHWWSRNPFRWAFEMKTLLADADPFFFVSWTTSKMPCLRWALSKTSCCGCIVHVGNPLMTNWRGIFINRMFDLLLCNFKKLRPILVGCSEYVAGSIKRDRYYSSFKSVGILNAVRQTFFENDFKPIDKIQNKMCNISRLDAMKNQNVMIENVASLKENLADISLDIIGEGAERPNLERSIVQYKASGYIRLLGNRSDITNLLKGYDIFLFYASPREGMGIAIAEAMSKGLICVVNDTPLMHENLGECGVYYSTQREFQQQIERLQSIDIRALSTKTRERAEKLFKPKVFAEKYINILISQDQNG